MIARGIWPIATEYIRMTVVSLGKMGTEICVEGSNLVRSLILNVSGNYKIVWNQEKPLVIFLWALDIGQSLGFQREVVGLPKHIQEVC